MSATRAQTASVRLYGAVSLVLVLLTCAGCAMHVPAQTTMTEPQTPLAVKALALQGVESIDEERLRAALQTQVGSWWPPWKPDQPFDRSAFENDLKRIVAFYADHGYPDARIASYDIDVDETTAEAAITIRVEEGQPLLVHEVVLAEFDQLSVSERNDLIERLPVTVGEPLVYLEAVASGELVASVLQDRGYPYAEVRLVEQPVPPRSVLLRFEAEPGPQAWFGEIDIVGNASVDDTIIRRKLSYRPGELFRRSLLQDSQRQLYRLDLFRFANVEIIDPEQRSSEVKTRVTLAEAKHRQVQFSFGYGTEEKLRGELAWRHVNFLGGARTLGLRTSWSSLDRGAHLDFVQPYLLHPRLTLALNAHYTRANEPAYDLTARGGRADLLGEIDAFTRWRFTVNSEDQTSQVAQTALDDPSLRDELIALGLDPQTGRQGGLLTSLGLSAERITTRNPLDPQQGYQLSVAVEQAGSWLPGTFDFVEWHVAGRQYLPVANRVVVASRAEIATIDPSGTSAELPFAQRYFLGGSTSLRGWGRFEVSPLSASGLPLGGKSMFDSSAEVRARVSRNLGAVVFVDAGNVWRNEWQFNLADLRADVGAGVRYYTPIGPVRLDVAWQLTPIAGLFVEGEQQARRWRIHFSIGQAF